MSPELVVSLPPPLSLPSLLPSSLLSPLLLCREVDLPPAVRQSGSPPGCG